MSADVLRLLERLAGFLKPLITPILALAGVALGAWLTQQAQSQQRIAERRTRVLDEANELTAKYYLILSDDLARTAALDGEIMICTKVLDAKIKAHFSRNAYTAWRRVDNMISVGKTPTFSPQDFNEARSSALAALASELR